MPKIDLTIDTNTPTNNPKFQVSLELTPAEMIKATDLFGRVSSLLSGVLRVRDRQRPEEAPRVEKIS